MQRKRKVIGVSLGPELAARVEQIAASQSVTVSAWCHSAIEHAAQAKRPLVASIRPCGLGSADPDTRAEVSRIGVASRKKNSKKI